MGFNGPWFNNSKKDGNQIRMDSSAARLAEEATLSCERPVVLSATGGHPWFRLDPYGINPRKIPGKRYQMMI